VAAIPFISALIMSVVAAVVLVLLEEMAAPVLPVMEA
jgi:hypothetical protein